MIGITKDDAFEIVDTISKAREIVFCKDCVHYKPDVYGHGHCLIHFMSGWDADDFCSRGEKKDESD